MQTTFIFIKPDAVQRGLMGKILSRFEDKGLSFVGMKLVQVSEDLAKQHSSCPSGQRGGELGEFGPGQMVKEFDTVVFNEAVGEVHGPVKTQFGYHLLEVTSRS